MNLVKIMIPCLLLLFIGCRERPGRQQVFRSIADTIRSGDAARDAPKNRRGKRQQLKSIDGERLLSRMEAVSGSPYKWGGTDARGFDCSGFVYYVFSGFGIDTGHSTSQLATMGREIPMEDAKIGDILIFTGTDGSLREPGHAGIIVERTDNLIVFMHSSSSKNHYGVVRTEYENSGYPKRFLQLRRVADVF